MTAGPGVNDTFWWLSADRVPVLSVARVRR